MLKVAALTVGLAAVVWYLAQGRGVPWMFGLFVLLVVVMEYAFTRTKWGRSMFAVGGNREAARRDAQRQSLDETIRRFDAERLETETALATAEAEAATLGGESDAGARLEAARALTAPAVEAAAQARAALDALGEIVGRIDNERMLDKLFASFCIGK